MFNEAVQTAMHRDAEPDEDGDVTVLRAPTYKVTRSNRSGTNTSSTVKLVLGFKLRVLPKKKGEGVASQDLELPLEGASQEAATSAAVGNSSCSSALHEYVTNM